MSGKGRNTETEWTKENLQKLLAAIKSCIPQQERDGAYTKGLRAVDWSKVAFPPFSPEECKEKWTEFMQKMRKMRTLTELIDEAQHVVSNPSQNNKIHPELPKRPSPPNALFFEEKWANFQQKHPNRKMKKLFKNLMGKYKTLPEEEKAKYEKKFQVQLEDYNRKMEEFRKEYQPDIAKNKRKSTGQSTEGPPLKPPSSGYSLFCKEKGSSVESGSKSTCVQAWAQAWRALTEPQRDEYNTRSKELKMQYLVDIDKYITTLSNDQQEQQVVKRPRLNSPSMGGKGEFPGEPKIPARSGNTLFIQNQMKILERDCPNQRQRLSEISKRWLYLSNKERNVYKDKVRENLSEYSRELKKWFKTLSPAKQVKYRNNNPSKCQYLDAQVNYEELNQEHARASDSEDEDLEDSSSDEEPVVDCREFEEEEEEEEEEGIIGDDIMFELF